MTFSSTMFVLPSQRYKRSEGDHLECGWHPTYRRDRMTQAASYSPCSIQVKPFPSLRKKIADYQEEKRRNFNPFTPVRETLFGKRSKRSRRSQRSGRYRKLDMGHSSLCTVTPMCPTISTTTTAKSRSTQPHA